MPKTSALTEVRAALLHLRLPALVVLLVLASELILEHFEVLVDRGVELCTERGRHLTVGAERAPKVVQVVMAVAVEIGEDVDVEEIPLEAI